MKRPILSALLFVSLMSPLFAQEAPPPRKMPRTPVNRESLQEQRRNAAPASREVQGQAIVIDGEKLRVGEIDLRLFGIVPPQLSASFGPQARAALDELTAAQATTCTIRDRDREERFLATCHNANNADLALELLRRGLAVTARGSVASTDLAASYMAAEQAATTQKIGLWSVVTPTPAVVSDAVKPDTPAISAQSANPPPSLSKKLDDKSQTSAVKIDQNQQLKALQIPVKVVSDFYMPAEAVGEKVSSEPGFLQRYQLLVTGLIILLTTLGLFGAIAIQRLRDRRAEMQAIAAALRGELMAAHAVCRARLRSSTSIEDKDITWPRLRSTLYQAYVGRIGWLGAELARRIASIYGQASDYAAYYVGDDEIRAATMPKRQALQALVQHIDDVLPRLAILEHTGNPSSVGVKPPRPVAVVVPMNANVAVSTPAAQVASPSTTAPESTSLGTALTVMTNVWNILQKFVHAPWDKNKVNTARDPIAEYTAMIEEEMKRFTFADEDDESSNTQVLTDPSSTTWSSKTHEAL